MNVASAAAAISILFLAPQAAFAWGAEGHQIIAHIAAGQLTPSARSQVQNLLGADAESAMVEASTWADEIRPSRPSTAPWHFVNIPIGSRGYDPQRDCRRDDCVVAQIDREQRIISDRSLLAPVRAEALRFLIHFVGDIHQPLHASNNSDRGGNDVRVVLGRRTTNLHAVWDVEIVRALGGDPETISSAVERSIRPADRNAWQGGTVTDWANETFRVASSEVYDRLTGSGGTGAVVVLPMDYAASKRAIVETQLKRAGIRFAWLLNQTLR